MESEVRIYDNHRLKLRSIFFTRFIQHMCLVLWLTVWFVVSGSVLFVSSCVSEVKSWGLLFCSLRSLTYPPSWYLLQGKCSYRQPHGKEIYRKGTISVYEVDGKENKVKDLPDLKPFESQVFIKNKHALWLTSTTKDGLFKYNLDKLRDSGSKTSFSFLLVTKDR